MEDESSARRGVWADAIVLVYDRLETGLAVVMEA